MNYEQTMTWVITLITGTILICIGGAFGMNDHMAFNHEMGAFLGTIGSLIVIASTLFGLWAEISGDQR
ncbi:MAG: hypothetical protein CBD86_03325 [Gammaproteobacteria bacterium TMED226]|nr:MAG: hypothetical protein CBD86_03325 [Gammaproteobacteria bacterium TMED226]|tara:strand:- start:1080 stop:1283 length:204 start_codon:yes stop_codon:yes gene_type:complete